MRNLTIKREKSFVGCLVPMKVYIEDPESWELKIHGTPCRKVGEIKNGAELTISIEEHSLRVYVIGDKMSKEFCNDVYMLPEGDEDVYLSGKNKFKPSIGNAFRFHNNTYAEAAEGMKQNKKRGAKVMLAAVVVGAIVGFLSSGILTSGLLGGKETEPKTFTKDAISIELTDAFQEAEMEPFDVCYESRKAVVFVISEPFHLMEGLEDYTLEEYAQLVVENNNINFANLKTEQNFVYFVRDAYAADTDETYRYLNCMYKSNESFWLIQFATLVEDYEIYEEDMIAWAKSVTFSD